MSAVDTEEAEPDEEEVGFFFFFTCFPIIIHSSFIKGDFLLNGCDFNIILLFLNHIPDRGDQINADNLYFLD